MFRRRGDHDSRGGYTLQEALIAITIVAILAGLALPTYTTTRERGYWRGSRDILLAIHAGEQVFRSQNATYCQVPATCTWQQIFMDDPNGNANLPVTINVTPADAGTFTATATRNGGPCDTETLTLNQNRVFVGNWGAASSGTPGPAACRDY